MYLVEWYDARGYMGEGTKPVKPYKKLLAIKTTAGIEIKKDQDCVIIITEKTEGEDTPDDFTVIPRKWIKKITKL